MKKINVLLISGVSSIILFLVLTFIQSKIIDNEKIVVAYIANADVARDSEIDKGMLKEINVPNFLIENTSAILNIEEFDGKYAKEAINKGQIIFSQDIATKEELKIIKAETGLEKIAVKIKSSENALAYQVKPKDRIHLYFTGKGSTVKEAFITNGIEFSNSENDNVLLTAKILENIEILGIFDEFGRGYENDSFNKLDTIVIAVEPDVAKMINNLRNQGTFDITG